MVKYVRTLRCLYRAVYFQGIPERQREPTTDTEIVARNFWKDLEPRGHHEDKKLGSLRYRAARRKAGAAGRVSRLSAAGRGWAPGSTALWGGEPAFPCWGAAGEPPGLQHSWGPPTSHGNLPSARQYPKASRPSSTWRGQENRSPDMEIAFRPHPAGRAELGLEPSFQALSPL